MTGQPIPPVIPSPGRLAGTPRVRPDAVRPLPMAGPGAALSAPADVVYGTGRIDASGRVTDQAIARCALGWREGDRLTLTAEPGVVVARRDPRGMVTVPARACLAIPAVLRRRCGLRAGPGPAGRQSPARTSSPPARSPWWTRPSAPTAYSFTAQEDSLDTPHPDEHPAASQQAIVDAALLMLRQMGRSPGDPATARRTGRRYRPSPTTSRWYPLPSTKSLRDHGNAARGLYQLRSGRLRGRRRYQPIRVRTCRLGSFSCWFWSYSSGTEERRRVCRW
jgi:hypothetical protein